MCSIKAPAAPEYKPPPQTPKVVVDQAAEDARERERRRSLAQRGMRSVLATGAKGVTDPAPLAQKQLLGQ